MLYLVATPIGNLGDITLRCIRTLETVDVIFAEDTRRTLGLLNHLGIKKPLLACHEHNERQAAAHIAVLLGDGKTAALVSDAGLPGISDPGSVVVQTMIEQGLPFCVLPGASAATTALVMSGLPCARFVFEGFLPRDKKQLAARLRALSAESRTAILYESPLRLHKTLQTLLETVGDRTAAVCRELTKIHEECRRGRLSELAAHYSTSPPKGECVIVLGGAQEAEPTPPDMDALLQGMRRLTESEGLKPKEAAKRLATVQVGANELYAAFLKIK